MLMFSRNGSAGSSIASAEETGRLLGVNQEEEEEEEEDEMRIEDDMADTVGGIYRAMRVSAILLKHGSDRKSVV